MTMTHMFVKFETLLLACYFSKLSSKKLFAIKKNGGEGEIQSSKKKNEFFKEGGNSKGANSYGREAENLPEKFPGNNIHGGTRCSATSARRVLVAGRKQASLEYAAEGSFSRVQQAEERVAG